MRRTLPLPLPIVIAALFVVAPSASAASSATIFRDAADGRIDETYKLSELRKADSEVSAEQREYYGWDAVYADAVRRLSDPEAAAKEDPVVIPVDSNQNGTIDPAEKAAAETKRKVVKKQIKKEASSSSRSRDDDDATSASGDGSDEDVTAASSRDGDDGSSPLLWLLLLLPLAIIAFGVWRMQQAKRGKTGLKRVRKPRRTRVRNGSDLDPL